MKKIYVCAAASILALIASTSVAAEHAKGHDDKKMPNMFEANDTDKDGTVSKSEWQARGDKMFGEIDANTDGKISQDEMKAHKDLKRAEWQKRRLERGEALGKPEVKAAGEKATKPAKN